MDIWGEAMYQSGPGMGLPAAKATPGTVLSAGEMALLEHGLGKARVPSPEDGSDSDSSSLSVDSADEALVPVGPLGGEVAAPQQAPPTAGVGMGGQGTQHLCPGASSLLGRPPPRGGLQGNASRGQRCLP